MHSIERLDVAPVHVRHRAVCALFLAAMAAVACGGGAEALPAPAPHADAPRIDAGSADTGGPPTVPPSERASLVDVLVPETTFAARVDLRRLRALPIYAELRALMEPPKGPGAAYRELQRTCGLDPLETTSEIVIGFAREKVLVAAQFAGAPDRVLACAQALVPDSVTGTFADRPALRLGGDGPLVLADGDVVLMGDPATVEAALRARRAPEALARSIELSGAMIARGYGEFAENDLRAIQLEVTADDTAFRIGGRATLGSDAAAQETQRTLRRELANLAPPKSTDPRIVELSITPAVRADGVAITVTFEASGDPRMQIAHIAATTVTAISGIRSYIGQAKAAEARATVQDIAKRLATAGERAADGALPPSAPRVPPVVPKNRKHRPGPNDFAHASWQAIDFRMGQPFYFSYEFTTSPDRKSAVVIGRGDLNGDGKQSRFGVRVAMDKARRAVVGRMKEHDPYE